MLWTNYDMVLEFESLKLFCSSKIWWFVNVGRGGGSGWLDLHPDALGHKEPVGKEVMTEAIGSKIAHDLCKNTFGYCNL